MSPLQNYISNELTHVVGRGLKDQADYETKQYELLTTILRTGVLKPGPDFPDQLVAQATINHFGKLTNGDAYDPAYVCFCDIPVKDLHLHINKYSPFGLSFLKSFLIPKGANPVFYVAQGSGVPKPVFANEPPGGSPRKENEFDGAWEAYKNLLDQLWDTRIDKQLVGLLDRLSIFLDFNVFTYVKVFDDSLPEQDAGNYYMEREWRTLGRIKFHLQDVHRVLLPHSFVDRFKADFPDFPGSVTTI